VLSSYAAARVVVRLLMQELVRRFTETGVLTGRFHRDRDYALFPFSLRDSDAGADRVPARLGLARRKPLTIMLTLPPPLPAGTFGREALGMRLTVNKITRSRSRSCSAASARCSALLRCSGQCRVPARRRNRLAEGSPGPTPGSPRSVAAALSSRWESEPPGLAARARCSCAGYLS